MQMSPSTSIEIVERPIGLKIFAIAVSLLVLMIVVALSSSINLKLVRQELPLLSDYYIRLDQMVGDIRVQIRREVIQIERIVELKNKDACRRQRSDESRQDRCTVQGGWGLRTRLAWQGAPKRVQRKSRLEPR